LSLKLSWKSIFQKYLHFRQEGSKKYSEDVDKDTFEKYFENTILCFQGTRYYLKDRILHDTGVDVLFY